MMKYSLTVCAVCFCICLFGMAIAFWVLPQKSFSKVEKRALQPLPKPDGESVLSGDYRAKLDAFYADHFPLREEFVAVKARAEMLLGKGENNGILCGAGERLARRRFDMLTPQGTQTGVDFASPWQVAAACDGILRAGAALQVPFAVLLPGRNLDVCPSAFSYPSDFSDALVQDIRSRLSGQVAYPDLICRFRSAEESYYRTDHHWTTAGAYLGYCAAMEALGRAEEILPESEFERTVVSDSFRGTLWAASGMHWIKPDRVEIWLRGNEADFEVTADGRHPDGFYSPSKLTGGDDYAIFLDGTHDVVTIRKKTDAERPCLLILRDSFASSMAPFLAQHYDLVLLNLSSTRRDFTHLSALAGEYGADAVLLVYSIENLLTANKLPRLQ